jgi:L-alanine-DL-glutamate epimerase-like enolase superfamily enzyme
MKITSIDVMKLKRLAFSAQTPVLCRINTDEGIYGYGEAGVSIMDFSLGSFEIMKTMGRMIIGANPLDIDVIYSKLASTFWAQGNGGVIMAAISAIDTALWDLKAKYFGVPLYVLLGGKHRNKLRAYASQLQNGWKYREFMSAPGDLEFLRAACQSAVDEGYTAVKIDFMGKHLDGSPLDKNTMKNYIPKPWLNEFLARVAVARETIGPTRTSSWKTTAPPPPKPPSSSPTPPKNTASCS